MEIIESVTALRKHVSSWRDTKRRLGFVPTMGNLHQGHLQLVEQSRSITDYTVVSIFVNPMQFSAGEDYKTYPRTLTQDCDHLVAMGVDVLFCPSVDEMYPQGMEATTQVEVPKLSYILCGAQRAGHFVGVTTVVSKLFNMVQPDVAFFGEKDVQQLLIIKRMVADLVMPIDIVGVATVREADGLAMSSRNNYLSVEQRRYAPELYNTLLFMVKRIEQGEQDLAALENEALYRLKTYTFKPEYIVIRRQADLMPAAVDDASIVILTAAMLGNTRLIDNISID